MGVISRDLSKLYMLENKVKNVTASTAVIYCRLCNVIGNDTIWVVIEECRIKY